MNSYNVPLIPQNLSKQETIVQIAEVLNHLNNVTEDIFSCIRKRLDQNGKTLLQMSSRIDKVHSQIDKLKGAKNATQVFSSSKYPAIEVNRQYISAFKEAKSIPLVRHKVKNRNFPSSYEPLDKLQIYHVKVPQEMKEKKLTGLGTIPHNVKNVNDLLLYNSGKNLYKNFEMLDALKGNQTIKEEEGSENYDIGAAPLSISERNNVSKSAAQQYFYTPQIGQVPALDVPADLPDLPGIADDLRYESKTEAVIAPSASSVQLNELPDIEQIEIPKPDTVVLPPPPPMQEEVITPIMANEPEELKKEEAVQAEPVPEPPKLPPVLDARASLMEAIRNAGGSKKAKLKSVEPEKETVQKPAGGDLMADLHNKLLMRRKGISGTKNQDGIDPDSTLGKISAMIPPPGSAKTELADSSLTEDEDWD